MIVVDTSVWVAAFRRRGSPEAEQLAAMLDEGIVALAAPVRVEILCGASGRDRARLRRALSALPVYFPTDETWSTIDGWIECAGRAGDRFGFADLLIGALATEHGAPVWSLDADFARMAVLALVQRYEPRR